MRQIRDEDRLRSVAANQGDVVQCGASSLRWKNNVQPFLGGLDVVRRLNPISYNWKEGGQSDICLGAEDVAKVAPGFTFDNDKGEISGVKYERLAMLLINAVKEQQMQLEAQEKQNAVQQKQIGTLLSANAALNTLLRTVEKRLPTKRGMTRRHH